MTIEKAIEILNDWGIISEPQVDQDLLNAVKLGVEALKKLQGYRLYCQYDPEELLPGETEGG